MRLMFDADPKGVTPFSQHMSQATLAELAVVRAQLADAVRIREQAMKDVEEQKRVCVRISFAAL